MTVAQEVFPVKRCPSVGAFVLPIFSDQQLLQSLFILSQEISALQPHTILLKKSSASIIRKSRMISVLFEQLVRNSVTVFSPSAALCFKELYIVLQRIRKLLEDCCTCSNMLLLMQISSTSNSFHQLIAELSTLFDIFPAKELNLNQDAEEWLDLIKMQCSKNSADCADINDQNLRSEVLKMLENIEREIVPDHSKLSNIFEKLGLNDGTSCSNEIENLEDEVESENDDFLKANIFALIGLVRYAKCVLYGSSTPIVKIRRQKTIGELNIPADFRCPISLELMRDPVVVSTGQSYDRLPITLWIESGHTTCPKTGQTLSDMQLIPNISLKNLIAIWCRDQRIPFESTEVNDVSLNKTALKVIKMIVRFLVNKLKACQTSEAIDGMVHELCVLAETDSDSRACILEAGVLPLLVKFLDSENPRLQVNSITTILNLSIQEANKTRIMETDGVVNAVIKVLKSGATWEVKGKAAATIYSLTSVHAYRTTLGNETGVVKALLDLARTGPTNAKRDALMAIMNMAGDSEAIWKLMEGGVLDVVEEVMDAVVEEAVAVLEVVVECGGYRAVCEVCDSHGNMVNKLREVVKEGSDRAKEIGAATLVNVCYKGGMETVAKIAGIEMIVEGIMGNGTERARNMAATLSSLLRRRAALSLIREDDPHYHHMQEIYM